MRVSLLTCTPGDELYSIFGHSALRVIDSSSVTDYVYNYGTFNFDDEGFYLKFIRGKLLYYISVAELGDFIYEYQMTNRGIREQVLNLSAEEKMKIQRLLSENLKEENKFYKYDFFLDNCTTRLRDMIVSVKTPHPSLPAVMPVNTTFRNAIHQYLDAGKQYWSKLGIDILLGAPTDALMTVSQQQFLPDNLMISLDSTKNVEIVQRADQLYTPTSKSTSNDWFTPLVFFSLLFSLFLFLSLANNKYTSMALSGLDGLIFFLAGLLGIVLIFMMTATDHSMTKNNFNIFWAWPTHLIFSFFINSEKKFVKIYALVTSISLVLLLLVWFWLPQQLNLALIPFVLLLIYRSAMKYLN